MGSTSMRFKVFYRLLVLVLFLLTIKSRYKEYIPLSYKKEPVKKKIIFLDVPNFFPNFESTPRLSKETNVNFSYIYQSLHSKLYQDEKLLDSIQSVDLESISIHNVKKNLLMIAEVKKHYVELFTSSILFCLHDPNKNKEIKWDTVDTHIYTSKASTPQQQQKEVNGYMNHRLVVLKGRIYLWFCAYPDKHILFPGVTEERSESLHNWLLEIHGWEKVFFGLTFPIKHSADHFCKDIAFWDRGYADFPSGVYGVASIKPHTVYKLNFNSKELNLVSQSFSSLFSRENSEDLHIGSNPVVIKKIDFLKRNIEFKPNIKILKDKNLWILSTFTTQTGARLLWWYIFEAKHPFQILCRTRLGRKAADDLPNFQIKSMSISLDTIRVTLSNSNSMRSFVVAEKEIYDQMICESPKIKNLDWLTGSFRKRSSEMIIKKAEWMYLDASERSIFNPSLMPLPRGSAYPYIAVGRAYHTKGLYKNKRSSNKRLLQFSALVYCFMSYNLECTGGSPKELTLPFSRDAYLKRMRRFTNHTSLTLQDGYHFYIGPEDGRLFWNQIESRFYLMYQTNSDKAVNTSRSLWAVALENVVPEIKTIISQTCSPLTQNELNTPRELLPNFKLNNVEKNWMLFNTKKDVFVSYEIDPHVVFHLKNMNNPNLLFNTSSSHLFSWIDRKKYRINQGTNGIPVQNQWFPEIKSQILTMQISHTNGRGNLSYYHLLTFFLVEEPYTVVKVLNLEDIDIFVRSNTKVNILFYISSMDIVHKSCSLKLEPAGPNDTLLLSYGIDDTVSGGIQVSVQTLVEIGLSKT